MKYNPTATANALAITSGIFYVACRVLVGLFPGLMFSIAQSWFHGVGLVQSDLLDLTLTDFSIGIVSLVIFAWITGYTFAVVYNYFSKK